MERQFCLDEALRIAFGWEPEAGLQWKWWPIRAMRRSMVTFLKYNSAWPAYMFTMGGTPYFPFFGFVNNITRDTHSPIACPSRFSHLDCCYRNSPLPPQAGNDTLITSHSFPVAKPGANRGISRSTSRPSLAEAAVGMMSRTGELVSWVPRVEQRHGFQITRCEPCGAEPLAIPI